jgi:hypothetical protein
MQAITWKPQQFRLTVFPDKLFDLPEPGWWVKLLGESPEERNVKSRELSQVEQGHFHQGRLVLGISAARVDWTYTAEAAGEIEIDLSSGLPTLGGFEDSLNDFRSITDRWLKEMCPSIARMAFGAVLLQPVVSHEKGYELLQSYLPGVKIDPQESSDFLYQINRPRFSKSGIPNLRMNRLSKWAVVGTQALLITAGKSVVKNMDVLATRLELDINTPQSFEGELSSDKLSTLFGELVELGGEIALRGDIS